MNKYLILLLTTCTLSVKLFAGNYVDNFLLTNITEDIIEEGVNKNRFTPEELPRIQILVTQLYKLLNDEEDAQDAAEEINRVFPNTITPATLRYPKMTSQDAIAEAYNVLRANDALVRRAGYEPSVALGAGGGGAGGI